MVVGRTPGRPGRRVPRTPPRPLDRPTSVWRRLKAFVKESWKLIATVGGALSALTAYVALIDAGRHARIESIAATISALRSDSSEESRQGKLDALAAGGLAEHLEPHIIQGLQDFIRGRAHRGTTCPPRGGTQVARRHSDVNHAFRLIAMFQAPNRGHHSYPDRVIDAFLVWWHGEEFKATPPELSGVDLSGDTLAGVNMRSGSFIGSCLVGAHFEQATLDSARFDSARLDSADFTRASMRSSSLSGARGHGVIFDRADLTDANLNGAVFPHTRFFATNLACATLGNAHLDSTYFSTADVQWAFFGGAHLAGVIRWSEIRDFHGAYVASLHDLTDSLVRFAHAGGAVPDDTPQAAWSESRVAQLRPGGACAQKR
jgi:Pentapeptide repeats (8 copies)